MKKTKNHDDDSYGFQMQIADLLNTLYTIQAFASSGASSRPKKAIACIYEIALRSLVKHQSRP